MVKNLHFCVFFFRCAPLDHNAHIYPIYPEKGPKMALFGGTFTKMNIFGPKICSKNAEMSGKCSFFSVTTPLRIMVFHYRLMLHPTRGVVGSGR